jgi:hypothetical protein
MILYEVTERNFANIQGITGKRHLPDETLEEIDFFISTKVKRIIIEYPYVDKDYRDTYYNDFAKRHAEFDRQCVRLHLFSHEFKDISELNETTFSTFQNGYQGFIVLRDTKVNTLGRSYIAPAIVNHRSTGYMSLSFTKVHINGFEFTVKAFPWMHQDGNVSRCAHVALWSVIRYFSDRYPSYSERLLYQITRLLQSERRTNPSCGMTLAQMSQVLKDCNFFPEIYPVEVFEPAFFNRLLYTIVESGIPSVTALKGSCGEGHAVALLGHGPLKNAVETCKTRTGIVDCYELVPYLIASDDNFLPYTKIVSHSADVTNLHGNNYSYENVCALIVPYYEKMLLDIASIFGGKLYKGCLCSIEKNFLTFPDKAAILRRSFLTSSRSYKKFISKHAKDKDFREKILLLEMPRFIWLVEYATPEQFEKNDVQWLIVLDASAMNYFDYCFLTIKNGHDLIINQSDVNPKTPFPRLRLDNLVEKQYTNNLEAVL